MYAQLGCPYVYGGTGPCHMGFDCSGLVQAAWAAAGVQIPRDTYWQWAALPHVPLSSLEPGDLLMYNGVGHVAMYVGGGYIIERAADRDERGENPREHLLVRQYSRGSAAPVGPVRPPGHAARQPRSPRYTRPVRRTLIVTNDFPPRRGGIQSFVHALATRLPAGTVTVYAPAWKGAAEFDARQPFPVIRHPASLMLPVPATSRRAAAIAAEHGCDTVLFGAAAPLGLLTPALPQGGSEPGQSR